MLTLYPTISTDSPLYKVYQLGKQPVWASEMANDNRPIVIEDLTWYEKFSTTTELLTETWARIENRSKQGLLRRAFTLDFEKYLPNGKVEIWIAVSPHC